MESDTLTLGLRLNKKGDMKMRITCKEYNRRWREKNGDQYVVRYLFDKWVVCDGYAPDCDTEIDENAIFVGKLVKVCDSFTKADTIRNLLNE